MTTPDREQLSGYVMRDYDQLVATLRRSWLASGASQREVARRMGDDTHVYVSRWLSGQVVATAVKLFDLADALGYDLALIPRKDTSKAEAHCEACG